MTGGAAADRAAWAIQVELDGRGPIYEQIKRAVTGNIRSGAWPAGHRIPPEESLARHLGTARGTVHRALRELTDDGLLVRKRRAGTFVAVPPQPSALLEIVDMSRIIPDSGRTYGYQCLRQDVVEALGRTAERLGLSEGDPVRHVVCRHTADGAVVELEERWINLMLLPQAGAEDFSDRGPGSWLLETIPWTEAEHTVRAVNADAELATLLDTGEEEACLVLERRTFQAEAVVTFARLTHPGDRHRMTSRFGPDG